MPEESILENDVYITNHTMDMYKCRWVCLILDVFYKCNILFRKHFQFTIEIVKKHKRPYKKNLHIPLF